MDEPIVVRAWEKYQHYVFGVFGLEESEIVKQAAFRYGMIAMGCELETQARLFEAMRGIALDESLNSSIASALRATVQSVGIADEVDDAYQSLVKSERGEHDASRSDSAAAGGLSSLQARPLAVSDPSSPLPESHQPPTVSIPHLADSDSLWPKPALPSWPGEATELGAADDDEEYRSHAHRTDDPDWSGEGAGTTDEDQE